ncbi:MAG: MFS transporter [Woeseiaceae bacterium]|jgi:predicted MFS family arabinose efflux permease|nr:MFS transporter [Woeseiaceae bacterium]|tara:strand:+ start:1717 stop:2889 length:1173 start_codon:yes stop_codon:yes gene_type:complete
MKRIKTEFDGWRSISLSLYMSIVGYGVMVGIPVISTAWASKLGFTAEQVGRVAGADLGGLAFGAIITALVISKMNRRYLVLVGIILTIFANYLCTIYEHYDIVLWLRVISGIGNGIYTAVAVAALGATIKPTRAYNFMLFAFAFSQAMEVRVLPQLSMDGIYWFFIGWFLVTLLFIKWVVPFKAEDSSSKVIDSSKEETRIPTYILWLCMAAIFISYINIGAYWVYIELASLSYGISEAWTGGVLFWASLLTLIGCAFAAFFSNRYGLVKPLIGAQLMMIVIVGMLVSGISNMSLLVSVFMFNFLWIFNDVFQMSTVATIDNKGSFAALIVGAQGLGQIVGPNIAASILGAEFGYGGVFFMCASATALSVIVYLFMYKRLRLYAPKLFDA